MASDIFTMSKPKNLDELEEREKIYIDENLNEKWSTVFEINQCFAEIKEDETIAAESTDDTS